MAKSAEKRGYSCRYAIVYAPLIVEYMVQNTLKIVVMNKPNSKLRISCRIS
jgi:hypothetical protein